MSDGSISGTGKIGEFTGFLTGISVKPATKGSEYPHVVELQNGLPLLICEGQPAMPAPSLSRSIVLRTKRLIDLLVGTLALIVLLPLIVLVAGAIKLTSRGPVIFRQDRVGLNGRTFRLLKFRSLRVEECDADGIEQVVENDRRLTPIGEFLRVSSLDELPQLINIIIGDMSLVGPRPHVAGQLAADRPYVELVPYYNMRCAIVPGLTGWAQANGLRGPTVDPDLAKSRIDHDVAYIQNVSLILDIRILARTIAQELILGKTKQT